MDSSEAYGADNQPMPEDISAFISNDPWREMNTFLWRTYDVLPQIAFSGCSG